MAKPLPVPFFKQNETGYCLTACVQMVLAFQDISRSQDVLAKQLKADEFMLAWLGMDYLYAAVLVK